MGTNILDEQTGLNASKGSRYEYAIVSLYDDLYKEDAMQSLAGLMDIVTNVYGFKDELAQHAFLSSGIAEQFERHNPAFISGKSSLELAQIMTSFIGITSHPDVVECFDRSRDWWAGWVLAWYQFDTGALYKNIFDKVSYTSIKNMYLPLHEAHESKFVEELRKLINGKNEATRLKAQREAVGFSQSQLAKSSGVGLRAIQMYEQRNKDINKAQAITLLRLANALHCEMSDLMELA